jgi:hypothetical protein
MLVLYLFISSYFVFRLCLDNFPQICVSYLPNTCYMFRPSHSFTFYRPNNYRWKLQKMELNGVQFSQVLCSDISHTSKYLSHLFSIKHPQSMKTVAPCNMVEFYRRIRGVYYLHYQGDDDGGSKNLWNVGKLLPDYTTQYPRKQLP